MAFWRRIHVGNYILKKNILLYCCNNIMLKKNMSRSITGKNRQAKNWLESSGAKKGVKKEKKNSVFRQKLTHKILNWKLLRYKFFLEKYQDINKKIMKPLAASVLWSLSVILNHDARRSYSSYMSYDPWV